MASTKLMETKDGRKFWKISVSRGHGVAPYTKRFYWPEGYSARAAERALNRAVKDFELECESGSVHSRAEQKALEAAEAAAKEQEAAKLTTVEKYALGVYMPSKELSISENTRASYLMNLEKHILPAIGSVQLKDVTPAMITKLLLDLQRQGYSHASITKIYNILNGIFEMAFLDESVTISPMLRVKRPAQRKDETAAATTDQALTTDELKRVLLCLENEPLKWRTYITLAADTGARRGELCGLQWQDIDWSNETITISRNVQYTVTAGVYVTSPKNGKTRKIDIGPDSIKMLRALQKEQSNSCMSPWVFSQDGTTDVMHPQSPTRYFKKFGDKYEIDNFHPHILRHSFASIAITNGADVVSVSERLGHSDTSVTLRMYAHANEESIRKAGQIARNALKTENE